MDVWQRKTEEDERQPAVSTIEDYALADGEDNTTRARPRRERRGIVPLLADEDDYEEKSPDLGRVRGSFRWVLWGRKCNGTSKQRSASRCIRPTPA